MLPATFSREINFFNRMGFGVLYVNFRGSLGAGQDSVDSLLGLVGDTDVKDCVQALEDCLKVTFVITSIYPSVSQSVGPELV